MGTRQGNLLGGALFALTHLKVLYFYNKIIYSKERRDEK
jgi:hypothetical protein